MLKNTGFLPENSLSEEHIVANAPSALSALRDPAIYAGRSQYGRAANLVRRAMEFVSAAHYPVRWYPPRIFDELPAHKERRRAARRN